MWSIPARLRVLSKATMSPVAIASLTIGINMLIDSLFGHGPDRKGAH